jgi:hypothetical protein
MGLFGKFFGSKPSNPPPLPARNDAFLKPVGDDVSAVGNDEFWAIVKAGKAKRKNKDFRGAIVDFERAVSMAHAHGFGAVSIEVEIARTMWHSGAVGDAIKLGNKLLPDMSAIKLLISIYRERAKECVKAGDTPQALACFECIENISKLGTHTGGLYSAADRATVKKLKAKK